MDRQKGIPLPPFWSVYTTQSCSTTTGLPRSTRWENSQLDYSFSSAKGLGEPMTIFTPVKYLIVGAGIRGL